MRATLLQCTRKLMLQIYNLFIVRCALFAIIRLLPIVSYSVSISLRLYSSISDLTWELADSRPVYDGLNVGITVAAAPGKLPGPQ